MISVEKPGSPLEILEHLDILDVGKEVVLEHFGTKGMQWGVRKEKQAVSAIGMSQKQRGERREKRAKGHEATAKAAQADIDKIKANPSRNAFVQAHREHHVKELKNYRDTHLKAAKDIREGHLTDHQKHVIIGVAVVGGVIAAYGTYKVVDSGTMNQFLSRNTPLKTNDLLSRKMSTDSIMKEVVSPINPNYGAPGTKMNCRRATMAYEMRRRGYDVKATNSIGGTGQTPLSLLRATDPNSKINTGKISTMKILVKESLERDRWNRPVEGPVTKFIKEGHGLGKTPIGDADFKWGTPSERSSTIFKSLSKNPEGARGELGMRWRFGGAHSMAWEIIGGKPVIIDTQSGKHYTQKTFEKTASEMSHVASTRLDDQPLNTKFLKRWIRNVR